MGIAIARNSTCLSTMPPQRTRNLVEDSRSEASSSKEKYMSLPLSSHTISKGRRNGDTATLARSSLKDVFNATQVTFPHHNAQDDVAKVCEAISPPTKPHQAHAAFCITRSLGPPSTPPCFMPTGTRTTLTSLQLSPIPTTRECSLGLGLDDCRPRWHGQNTAVR